MAVHADAAFAGATDDLVPRHSNHPLDQMAGRALGGQPDEFEGFVPRSRINWPAIQPATWVGEDDDVAPLKVGELLHNHPVTYQKRVLHRLGGDDEHLPDEGAEQ